MGTYTGTMLSYCIILFRFLLREISGGPESSPNQGYVNELYCILEPNIPLDIVTTRSKALALQLWQNTKQALAPFPLIN